MKTSSRALLAASLLSALALPAAFAQTGAQAGSSDQKPVHCYGVNKCKGVGDCGGQGNSCKGKNSCKHQGYVEMDKDTCLKLDGGRLTPEEPKS